VSFHVIRQVRCTTGVKYDKQDRQGKAAFNERSPHPTQQQAPAARSPGGPQRKTGHIAVAYLTNIFISFSIEIPKYFQTLEVNFAGGLLYLRDSFSAIVADWMCEVTLS
jgi:hypothetical protein